VSYLSVSAVVIHYEEALYQVYAPLRLPFTLKELNSEAETECKYKLGAKCKR